MTASKIEWTDRVWNPVTGCTKVSAGCKNCYAERFAGRNMGQWKDRDFGDVRTHEERLNAPLHWQKPAKIFVNSMSDLFHKDVPFDFIDRVFLVMASTLHHTYQILTKRPDRMLEYLSTSKHRTRSHDWSRITPLPNVHLGISVENQKAADERVSLLLRCPSAVRFLSCEPMLGPVQVFDEMTAELLFHSGNDYEPGAIDWIICGGESGPGARPMHPDWARSLRDQCKVAAVPFHFKQWGEWKPITRIDGIHESPFGGQVSIRAGKKKSGRLLDGVEHNAFPVVRP